MRDWCSTNGRSSSREGRVASSWECTHGMLTRFETRSQLQSFLRLPPCQALQDAQGEQLPLQAALSFAYSIAPPASSRSSSPQSALL